MGTPSRDHRTDPEHPELDLAPAFTGPAAPRASVGLAGPRAEASRAVATAAGGHPPSLRSDAEISQDPGPVAGARHPAGTSPAVQPETATKSATRPTGVEPALSPCTGDSIVGTGAITRVLPPNQHGIRRPLVGRLAQFVAILGRLMLGIGVVLGSWLAAIALLSPPPYMLPTPLAVIDAFGRYGDRLAAETAVTLTEIGLGLVAGTLFGILTGLLVAVSPLVGRVVTPLLVVSQALPVFALAPLLVLWFGFGLASKVVMTTIIIYFPVASALADGLSRTNPGLLDIARLARAGRWRTLALIRFPAALPALVTGIRVAAVFAPIGAVIGEWVGASAGLGLLMVQANARMQTDLLFAALVILALATLALRIIVERATRRLIPWVDETG